MPGAKLSQNVEDYLETIHLLEEEKGKAKVKDIAKMLGIRPPSVTEEIRKLAKKGLVSYERYGPIGLTAEGKKVAKKVYEKHKLLSEFFMLHGVDEKTAKQDACLAEHVLSKKTIRKLKKFVEERRRG